MKRKLFTYALISSPLFALYAASHPIIFGVFGLEILVLPIMGLTVNIFILWTINIFLTLKFKHITKIKKVALSYLSLFIFQIVFSILGRLIPFRQDIFEKDMANFLLHPIITSIVINVIILIICDSVEAYYKKDAAELRSKELELENSEAQKKLLIQQLQPHFLFNSLSVLKSLINENPSQAEDYTIKLSEFLRYSVESHKKELVTVEEELSFVHDFIDLQKVRFDDSFVFSTQLSDETKQQKIPIYALQTLVENAFKHNNFTAKNPLKIIISEAENGIEVWNNIGNKRQTESTKTGLLNLKKRFELNDNKQITINNQKDFFSVIVPTLNP